MTAASRSGRDHPAFRRVAIVAHEGKKRALDMRDEITRWLETRNVAVTDSDPDLVLALGGDGTMLRAAQTAHSSDAPLLGINMGTLGYLTEVDAGAEQDALAAILEGSLTIEERMMLECNVAEGPSYVGLNEVLVHRPSTHRLVRLAVRIGGESLAAFNADGVIVATPTGSTAYALSAGGPIVSPRAQCLVLVPVSAHMIFSRPFVLSPDETVEIHVEDGGEALVSLDGKAGTTVGEGVAVLVRRHSRPLKMVRLSGPGFIERLRTKLGLPG